MTAERDDALGAALRGLPVPDHAPGFWDELERRLAEDDPGPGPRRPPRGLAGPALGGAIRPG